MPSIFPHSIVGSIKAIDPNRCDTAVFSSLLHLIMHTHIESNHDVIAEAITKKGTEIGAGSVRTREVLAYLETEKARSLVGLYVESKDLSGFNLDETTQTS